MEKKVEDELPGFDIRYTEMSDAKYLREWLDEKEILKWFPMADDPEIDDSVQRWIGFCRYRCSLTATVDGVPCGIATLYLQPYKKLAHQCEFGIIVANGFRGKGIGARLIKNLMHLGKQQFNIELLQLQVYTDNPAMNLYRRLGFREFGRQSHWIKDNGQYRGRVFMERFV
jgi:putative acetyltransferase